MKHFRYKIEFFNSGLYGHTLDSFNNGTWELVAFFSEGIRYVAIFKQEITAQLAGTPA